MAVSVIIPAYNSADTIAETVEAARNIPHVSQVIVVDDGSRDGTAEAAREAGADAVLVLPGNVGKGGAMAAGAAAAMHERLLFLDADLGWSAQHAGPLLDALEQRSAMSVAAFPQRPGGGGFGLARGLAAATIRLLGGIHVTAPLSGQRAMPAEVVRHLGLAPRFGVETALTAEAAHIGLPVIETPLPLEHRPTGKTVSGFLHRAKQFGDILRYAIPAAYGLGWPRLSVGRKAVRLIAWMAGLAFAIGLGEAASPGLLAAVAAAGIILWLPCLWASTIWLKLRKPNYLGRSLPAAAGILFPVVGLPAVYLSPLPPGERTAALIVIAVLGGVGLLDDLFASRRQARGLRGHLVALLHGRLTTGAVKAFAGLGAGMAAGLMLAPGRPGAAVIDALLIALAANAANLLDLRPSRAIKGFALLCAVAILFSRDSINALAPLLPLAVVAAPAEFAGRVMLGDVGANVLGGVAGLGLVVALSPWERVVAVALLAGFHLLCERVSFSQMVERSRTLGMLDRLGTSHLPPLPAREMVER
jgi:UDP-N-acetylmuramyl pentapeptide phosphotransferase/UDP-N-acetylglucosamine-1-phosphate transferase